MGTGRKAGVTIFQLFANNLIIYVNYEDTRKEIFKEKGEMLTNETTVFYRLHESKPTHPHVALLVHCVIVTSKFK